MNLTQFVVRARFDTKPKREAVSRSVKLLRDMFHVVNRMFTKSLRSLSDELRARPLVLIRTPSCVRMYEHIVLKCLLMKSGLRRTFKFGSLRSMHSESMMHANVDL